MNWLRRLLNGSHSEADEPTVQGKPGAATATQTEEPAAKQPPSTAQLPVSPPSLRDGVTRPLPPETSLPFSTGDHLIFGQASHVGMVRSNNQDAALSFFTTIQSVENRPDFGIFVVADGMGGHSGGEKASAISTRVVARELTNSIYLPMLNGEPSDQPIIEAIVEAVQRANDAVTFKVPEGGTTITTVVVLDNMADIGHVGDSRIYLITPEGPEQITRDHSYVQRLIELDQLTPEEAAEHPQRSVLYRALGQVEQLEVDSLTRRLPAKSRLLLCSDGLWNYVTEQQITQTILAYPNPQEACDKLINLANENGGPDNITAILLQMPG